MKPALTADLDFLQAMIDHPKDLHLTFLDLLAEDKKTPLVKLQQASERASLVDALMPMERASSATLEVGSIERSYTEADREAVKTRLSVYFDQVLPLFQRFEGHKNKPGEKAADLQVFAHLLAVPNTGVETASLSPTYIGDTLPLDTRNDCFMALYQHPALNHHRNPRMDGFFGNTHTASWQKAISSIRKAALARLDHELANMTAGETGGGQLAIDANKLALLKRAKTMPIFSVHRRNFWIQGAWGRTSAVREIESRIIRLDSQVAKRHKAKHGMA